MTRFTTLLLTAAIALAGVSPALACVLPLGPTAGIVRWEYNADRATCRHHDGRLRCTIASAEYLNGDRRFPVVVSSWVRVDWRHGVLHGDLEPRAAGFDLSWTYRVACRAGSPPPYGRGGGRSHETLTMGSRPQS